MSKRETFDLILKTAGDRKIDVVIAGPPCQGFSLTGPRNFDDPRNKLYLAVIEMVKQYNPKGFIIENVPGMANMYKGQVKDEVLKRFRKMGYNIDCRILKACDYGVPQMRKRLVFMGVRKDIGNPHFPDPTFGPETKKPYRTCRDAISDLPTRTNNLGKNEDEYVKPAETDGLKDDKISKEFYYLGRVIATGNAKQFVMPNTDKTAVEIEWELETPVREDIYQYIVNE